ncbi:MAG TPA: PPOX class F420-dependent oxidoreductase [Acidimicrobiales bacterium]|nr:PPOX class F420-dependent oxidoreductase [Acidimicrobiales bacterium]
MDADEARRFLQSRHRAVLITSRRDGRPQASPVLATVDAGGRVVVSSRETAMKAMNLARDSRASLCVLSDDFFGPWVQIDGDVEIVRRPEAIDVLVEYYRQVSGEHPDWDDYRAAMEAERRVALRLTITGAGPDRSG